MRLVRLAVCVPAPLRPREAGQRIGNTRGAVSLTFLSHHTLSRRCTMIPTLAVRAALRASAPARAPVKPVFQPHVARFSVENCVK
jgi:hypothetical protein